MDNVKTDAYFANKIRDDLMFVRKHTKNLDIVHDYGNVDLRIVYETLTTDIPNLLGLFENDQEEV